MEGVYKVSHGEGNRSRNIESFGYEVDNKKWVYNSSVDPEGRIIPSRSSTSSWKASFFIISVFLSSSFLYIFQTISITYILSPCFFSLISFKFVLLLLLLHQSVICLFFKFSWPNKNLSTCYFILYSSSLQWWPPKGQNNS